MLVFCSLQTFSHWFWCLNDCTKTIFIWTCGNSHLKEPHTQDTYLSRPTLAPARSTWHPGGWWDLVSCLRTGVSEFSILPSLEKMHLKSLKLAQVPHTLMTSELWQRNTVSVMGSSYLPVLPLPLSMGPVLHLQNQPTLEQLLLESTLFQALVEKHPGAQCHPWVPAKVPMGP